MSDIIEVRHCYDTPPIKCMGMLSDGVYWYPLWEDGPSICIKETFEYRDGKDVSDIYLAVKHDGKEILIGFLAKGISGIDADLILGDIACLNNFGMGSGIRTEKIGGRP